MEGSMGPYYWKQRISTRVKEGRDGTRELGECVRPLESMNDPDFICLLAVWQSHNMEQEVQHQDQARMQDRSSLMTGYVSSSRLRSREVSLSRPYLFLGQSRTGLLSWWRIASEHSGVIWCLARRVRAHCPSRTSEGMVCQIFTG